MFHFNFILWNRRDDVNEARLRGISCEPTVLEGEALVWRTTALADRDRLAEHTHKLRPDIELEATGGITLDTVRDYARTGVDFVSTGTLTHSVVSADLALETRSEKRDSRFEIREVRGRSEK